MKTKWIGRYDTVACLWVCILTAGIAAPAWGTAEVQQTATMEHDMGALASGRKYTHTFRYRNPYDSPFTIGRVTKGCGGCTDLRYENRTFAVGEEMVVEMTIDTEGKQYGPLSLEASLIDTTEPVRMIRLVMKGTLPVNGKLRSSLPQIDMGRMQRPATISREVTISRYDGTPVRFVTASTSHSGVKVAAEHPVSHDAERVVLTVEVDSTAMPLGPIEASVEVATNDSEFPTLSIPIRGHVQGMVSPEVMTLCVGRNPVGSRAQWVIRLTSQYQAYRIVTFSHTLGEGFSLCEVAGHQAAGDRPYIVLDYDGRSGRKGLVKGDIRIVTTVNGQSEEATIPVIGYLSDDGPPTTQSGASVALADMPAASALVVHDGSTVKHAGLALSIVLETGHTEFASQIEHGERVTVSAPASLAMGILSYRQEGFVRSQVFTFFRPDQRAPELPIGFPQGEHSLRISVEPVLEKAATSFVASDRCKVYRIVLLQQPNAHQTILRTVHLQQANMSSPAEVSVETLPSGEYDVIAVGKSPDGQQVRVGHRKVSIPLMNGETCVKAEPPPLGKAILRGTVNYSNADTDRQVVVSLRRRQEAKAISWAWMHELGTPDTVALTVCDSKSGRFTMNDLPEGEYTVTAYVVRGRPGNINGVPIAQQSKPVVLKANQNTGVELSLLGATTQSLRDDE